MILGCGSMHGRVLVFGSWSLPFVAWLVVLGSACVPASAGLSICIVYGSWSVALGQWLLHVSQLLVLDCMQACWSLVLGPVPHLGVEISRFTPCIY